MKGLANNMKAKICNAMTVDVEDYFQVSAFEKIINPSDWDAIAPRVEANTNHLLELFEANDVKATFFTLGWVAERFPDLIQSIAKQGHEIASHGYCHRRATQQSPAEFKQDVQRTRSLLQDLTGASVDGYRAPSFSINHSNAWAYDVLAEAGYLYSSSIYPVKHDHYGVPDAPRFKYKTQQGVWELPLTTLELAGRNIPISGGGFFRLYPYWLTRWAINRLHTVDDNSYMFYMHPWEIDPGQPRIEGIDLKTRFRHYLNISRVDRRMKRLLADFNWGSIQKVYFQG